MPSIADRYREEDGRRCIDLHLRTVAQLFDNRDPAPFRDRDLDAQAVEYLLGSLAELPSRAPVRVVMHCAEAEAASVASAEVVCDAVRAHFSYERDRLTRKLREHLRSAQLLLLIGVFAWVALLSLSQLAGTLGNQGAAHALREGLIITGWVVLWRPLDALLYEWLPLWRARRVCRRLLAAELHVRFSAAPVAAGPGAP